MSDPGVQQKWNERSVAMVSILPSGLPSMGKLLTLQFIYFVLGCVFIAYLASLAVTAGSAYMQVFYYVSIVGFVTFGFANIPYSLWYSHPWAVTARFMLDAIIYALVIAGTFAWLWPIM